MATRPVFEVAADGRVLFVERVIEFEWYAGFALQQKRRCIHSLHENYLMRDPNKRVLEISSSSEDELGVALSAFNLMMHANNRTFSVESAFQSSKVFEHGGPYRELIDVSSKDAKKDRRLKHSGRLVAFEFFNLKFPNEPRTFFYDWLYISALRQNEDLAAQLLEYDAFTDISFNPQRMINCQAESAAIYASLTRRNLLEAALADQKAFIDIVYYHRIDQ